MKVDEDKPEAIPEEVMQDMMNVWAVFDQKDTKAIPIKDLKVIMRALDIDLTPKELEEVKK